MPVTPKLHVWRFTPVAKPDDPAWQERQIWSDFRVVAGTAGEAILLASRHDAQRRGLDVGDSQDHQQLRSGFEDPLLYRVDRMVDDVPPAAPAGAVILEIEMARTARQRTTPS